MSDHFAPTTEEEELAKAEVVAAGDGEQRAVIRRLLAGWRPGKGTAEGKWVRPRTRWSAWANDHISDGHEQEYMTEGERSVLSGQRTHRFIPHRDGTVCGHDVWPNGTRDMPCDRPLDDPIHDHG